MKCKIKCMAYVPEENVRRWEITSDGKLWPCCYYANSSEQMDKLFLEDKELSAAEKQDPNWNDLNVYTIKEVEQHDIFQRYLFIEGWESDNPPPICVRECAAVIDEYTGEERSAAKIQISRG